MASNHNSSSRRSRSPVPRDIQDRDLYKDLGVGYKATRTEIRRAYLRLSLRHHPDKVAPGETVDATEFRKIQTAWEWLGDEERKKKYDDLWPEDEDEDEDEAEAEAWRLYREARRERKEYYRKKAQKKKEAQERAKMEKEEAARAAAVADLNGEKRRRVAKEKAEREIESEKKELALAEARWAERLAREQAGETLPKLGEDRLDYLAYKAKMKKRAE